ncbi:energy transducer TonB [Chryseobacterium sp. C-71]|uniref:energy transducer TonB n=1 Tax=Chryseobacterium sp. C-71 TaxID=2893882 RepID=UPI001E5ABAA8|nr:energy transducer TonB [Chryseobacterium sp. C-71]UFH30629.1 energy transducer TonB [Chryseobacterium sp. C-71]
MKKFILFISLIFSEIAFGQYTNSPSPPPPTTNKYPYPTESVDVVTVYENPDQEAEFSEGNKEFRNKLLKEVVLEAVKTSENEDKLKGMLSFVIERDGSMTDVKVTGLNESFNAEVKRAVRSIKNKWNPAIYKGKIVRSRLNIPVFMANKL